MRTRAAGAIALITMLAGAHAASAQGPIGQAYGGQGQVAGEVAAGSSTPPSVTPATVTQNGTTTTTTQPSEGPAVAGVKTTVTQGTRDPSAAVDPPGTGPSAAAAAPVSVFDDAGGGGGLPFTGLDVLLLLAGGGILIAAGMAIRRLTPPTPE